MTRLSSISTPMRLALVLLLAAAVSILVLRQDSDRVQAVAATGSPIYGKCTGQAQGVIKGGVTTKGREGTYAITAVNHAITVPRDPASGQATGRRQHSPVSFTMGVDRSTPQFLTALTNNENLKTCTFDFYDNDPKTGKETKYFQVKLTNGHVVDYKLAGRPGGQDTVTFSVAYQTIEWTYVNGGITSVDDWGFDETRSGG